MTLNIVSSFNGVSDPDAAAYIEAVEAADGELLEFAVGKAINDFVLGCKADGIWDAIKASCILAGARTLNGALVPLAGTAPTNFNFVAGDYDRKTGLVGNGSTKYLDSNRANNADPQNNRHMSVWISTAATAAQYGGDIGIYVEATAGNNYIGRSDGQYQIALSSQLITGGSSTVTGFRGAARDSSNSFDYRAVSLTTNFASNSVAPAAGNIKVFSGGANLEVNSRIAFYSIGESLDLALLDARVTDLINAFGAAIP